jgi:hypothetical protein
VFLIAVIHSSAQRSLLTSGTGTWEGKASDLERQLVREQSKVGREARQLVSFPTACGTYLGAWRNSIQTASRPNTRQPETGGPSSRKYE